MCVCARAHTHVRGLIYIHTHAHMYGCTPTRGYTGMCIYPTHSVTSVQSPKDRKRDWKLGYKRTNGDNLNYRIIKIDHNTKKCSGDLWRLAVT